MENTSDEKELRSKKKRPVILGIAAAACVAFLIIFSLMTFRSENRAWSSFAKAFGKGAEDRMLTVMFPRNQRDSAKKYITSEQLDLTQRFKKYFGSDNVKKYKISKTDEADDMLKADFDSLLEKMNISMDYKNLSSVTLSSGMKVVMYQVGSKWYILPDADKYMTELNCKEDIENAGKIYKASKEIIESNNRIREMMRPYYDVMISLKDEFDYLPPTFRNALAEKLGGQIPEIKNKRSGAVGFALSIDDGVYISSDKYLNEWETFDDGVLDEDYLYGRRSEDHEYAISTKTSESEFSYVKLIGDNSPILGYWQAEDGGMYIGYDTLGQDKRFMIFSTFYTVIYPYGGNDEMSGEEGKIYLRSGYEETDEATVTITVKDRDHIDLELIRSEDDRVAYQFERSELSAEILNRYAGNWMKGSAATLVTADTDKKIVYMDDWGMDSYTGTPICMYDGSSTMLCMLPYQGDWQGLTEYASSYPYTYYYMELDGEKMEYWGTVSGGDAYVEETFYKEGSAQAEREPMIEAFKNDLYIEGIEDYKCSFICFDDDDVPECICYYGDGLVYIMRYQDGNVAGALAYSGSPDKVKYKKKDGVIKLEMNGMVFFDEYIFWNDGIFSYCEVRTEDAFDEDAPISYVVAGEELSKDEYDSYIKSFGKVDKKVNFKYDSVEEAAEAFYK